jgi:3-phytase
MRAVLLLTLALTACAEPAPAPTIETASVTADAETVPVATQEDAADDPAIWRNAANPAASLIVATDKKRGLHVYGLDGAERSFLVAGRVNNVDLAATRAGVIVAASDRNDDANGKIALFRLDTATARLVPLGQVPAGAGEAYGICLWATPGGDGRGVLTAFVTFKEGMVRQVELDVQAGTGRIVRTLQLGSQPEGCVVDPRTARLYVGEEDVGIWRFDARTASGPKGRLIARVDGKRLFADVEGLAIAAEGPTNGGWLVASSQGDNAYALWRLSDERFAGRFRIVAGQFGATQETDGIEVITGDFGPAYPGGLMVVQDGDNQPAQNFKLLGWDKVKAALKLR